MLSNLGDMLDIRSKKLLGNVVMISVVTVTLIMAPYTLLDPVNLPKMVALAYFSIIALSFVVPEAKTVLTSKFRVLTILLSLFVLQIILIIFFSGASLSGQIYGTFGRNTGALAYLSLAFLLLSSALVANDEFLKKFIYLTIFIGVILIFYGNVQYLNLEPFPFVNAYTVNAPIGTFGNPDFQSAFMGLIAVVAFTMVLNNAFKIYVRFGLALVGCAALVVVYETIAKQGYLNFLAGAGVVLILWLFMTGRKTVGIAVSGVGIVGGGLIFLGLVNSGPFSTYLYKGSLAARGFYWRAALKMLTDHPFFGVGMDGFVDWYRRSRPADYFANNFFSISNAAHNVYLDIASSGGFPLIAIYCGIVGLVVVSVVRVVKRSSGFDVYLAALVGAWVAYQVQAFVSINQLGLAIWGWVLSGLIIGYEVNTRFTNIVTNPPLNRNQQRKKSRASKQTLSSATVISVFAGLLIGALVAIPPYFVNARFFSAIKSGDLNLMKSAAYLKPIDERRLLHVATILRDNKYDAQAIEVVRDAAARYPDSFDIWQLWASITTASSSDIAKAKAQIKRLDPFNPDL